jgi:hypothetical protein
MPDLFREWRQPPQPTPEAVIDAYNRGFAGAIYDPASKERFAAEMPNPNGEEVCHAYGFADTAAGKLVTPWVAVEKTYPGCWPASAQERGDCVSHSTRNAMLTTLVGEVVAGLPDAVSGKTEAAPEVSPEAQRDGVLSTEAIYRNRGHRGDGWSCSAAARVAVQTTGAVLRRDYPGIADLTKYNSRFAGGAAEASERDAFDDNKFREATEVSTFESIRDLLNRGFGVSSCGSEGFADKRDENGVSRRSGSWAHAMAYIGADDRAETHSKYGGPLVLVLNSWGTRWNSGPRTVRGTTLEIPPGSFWAKWSDLSRRDCYAIAGLNGWQRKELPDYLGGW